MSHQAQVPVVVEDYYRSRGVNTVYSHPLIRQVFRDGSGWRFHPTRKRISTSWVRKLRADGVTSIQTEAGGVIADFTVAEVLRGGVR